MKKDLEWLKKQVKEEYEYNRAKHNKEGFDGFAHREFAFKYVLDLIEQLDEPETLSQEWIDEESDVYTMIEIDGKTENIEYIRKDKLQNLLLPKQEKVKVPQSVADWLDDNIERYETVYSFIISLVEVFGDTVPEKVWTYASENPDTMARAYLDGYEVAEEPKYRLKLNDDYLSSVQIDYASKKGEPIEVTILADVKGLPYNFSEDEKAYVEKYLNVEVEELEE